MKILNHKEQLIELLGQEFLSLLLRFKHKKIDIHHLEYKTLDLIRKKSKQFYHLEKLIK